MNRTLFNDTAINANILLALLGDAQVVVEGEGEILAATYEADLEGTAEFKIQGDGELIAADTVLTSGGTARLRLEGHSAVTCNGDFCFDVGVRIGGYAETLFFSRGRLRALTRILLGGSASIGVELKDGRYGRPPIPSDYVPAHPEWSFRMGSDEWKFEVPRDSWGRG